MLNISIKLLQKQHNGIAKKRLCYELKLVISKIKKVGNSYVAYSKNDIAFLLHSVAYTANLQRQNYTFL
jgi:hypothetical protein